MELHTQTGLWQRDHAPHQEHQFGDYIGQPGDGTALIIAIVVGLLIPAIFGIKGNKK